MKKILVRIAAVFFIAAAVSGCKQVTENTVYKSTFVVTFDSNGGIGKSYKQTFYQDISQNLTANKFTSPDSNLDFAGWVEDSSSEDILYNDGQDVRVTDNMTLYAVWKDLKETESDGEGADAGKSWYYKTPDNNWEDYIDFSIKPGDDFYKHSLYGKGEENAPDLFGYAKDLINEWFEKQYTTDATIAFYKKAAALASSDSDNAKAKAFLNSELSRIDACTTRKEFLTAYIPMMINSVEPMFAIIPDFENAVTAGVCYDFCKGVTYDKSEKAITLNNLPEAGNGFSYTDIMTEDELNLLIESANTFINKMNAAAKASSLETPAPASGESFEELIQQVIGTKPEFANFSSADYNFGKSLFPLFDYIGEDSGNTSVTYPTLDEAKAYLKYEILSNHAEFMIDRNARQKRLIADYNVNPFNYEILKQYCVDNNLIDANTLEDNGNRAKIVEMCENLRKQMKERLKTRQWLTSTTINNLIEKLDAMYFLIGYPEEFDRELLYSSDVVSDVTDDWCESRYILKLYENMNLKLLKEYDSLCKDITANRNKIQEIAMITWSEQITDNASYSCDLNCMDICATNLVRPMLDSDFCDAYAYGVLGALLGHEMCHGFDSDGSKYDKDGVKNSSCWTLTDRLNYENKQAQMEKIFNKLTYAQKDISGSMTLAENLADLGGIDIAYSAFVDKKKAEGYSGNPLKEQKKMFFYAYSWSWSGEYLESRVGIDEHAPYIYRVNIPLANMPDWYRLFDVKKGDAYYLEPDQRVELW